MLVVPADALTNITVALLTAEPTDLTLDDSVLARLKSTILGEFFGRQSRFLRIDAHILPTGVGGLA
jgi:hypothetical protein